MGLNLVAESLGPIVAWTGVFALAFLVLKNILPPSLERHPQSSWRGIKFAHFQYLFRFLEIAANSLCLVWSLVVLMSRPMSLVEPNQPDTLALVHVSAGFALAEILSGLFFDFFSSLISLEHSIILAAYLVGLWLGHGSCLVPFLMLQTLLSNILRRLGRVAEPLGLKKRAKKYLSGLRILTEMISR